MGQYSEQFLNMAGLWLKRELMGLYLCCFPLSNEMHLFPVSVADEGRAEVNGLKASHFFSLAEGLNVDASPFVWLFIRPPWSLTGSCCKAVVYDSLKNECLLQSVSFW